MKRAVKSITIRGFKSIRNLEGLELTNLNVVIGANGAGKSNLVQVFQMLRSMTLEGFQKFIGSNGGADSCGEAEAINDSPNTSPSHRLRKLSPRFKKTTTGIAIAKEVGLEQMRESCPLFNAWVGVA